MVFIEMKIIAQIAHHFAVVLVLFSLAGCASGPPATYEIFTASHAGSLKLPSTSLVVTEPKASRALDSERMIVKEADGSISFVPDAQWSDRVPALVQTSLIKAIEANGYSVSREGSGALADHVLASDITAFNLVPGSPDKIELGLTMHLINAREGKLMASRSFSAEEAISSTKGADVVVGFNAAIATLMPTIARWCLTQR